MQVPLEPPRPISGIAMLTSPVVYLTDNGMVQVAVNHPYPTCTVHINPSYVDNGAIGDRNGEGLGRTA